MAIGDQQDVFGRLRAVLPSQWFGDAALTQSPILSAVLQGFAQVGATLYGLYAYAQLQTRLLTATDGWLDMLSGDFLGTTLPRPPNASDTSYRARIIAQLLRPRVTRTALANMLLVVTGRAPIIFEPERPLDTGAWGVAAELAYGLTGGYGSMLLPYQCFVTVFRPLTSGVPFINGYGQPAGGYGVASQAEWANISMVIGAVSDADINAAIESVRPVGTIIWTRVSN